MQQLAVLVLAGWLAACSTGTPEGAGCLEQEQRFGLPEFARQCLSTTADWSEHRVNDRIYPRRPFIFQPKAAQIDHLLSKQLRPYFSRIRIEPGG